jgi:hypothetical protein
MDLKVIQQLSVDGEVKASVMKTLDISASATLENVAQQGSHITGVTALKVDYGFGTAEVDIPFDIDTMVGNPIDVDLGDITLPVVGDVDVEAEFSYDIPGRQVCVALTLAGLVTVAKTCTNF